MDKNIRKFPETLNVKLQHEAIKKKMSVGKLIIEILLKYFKEIKNERLL